MGKTSKLNTVSTHDFNFVFKGSPNFRRHPNMPAAPRACMFWQSGEFPPAFTLRGARDVGNSRETYDAYAYRQLLLFPQCSLLRTPRSAVLRAVYCDTNGCDMFRRWALPCRCRAVWASRCMALLAASAMHDTARARMVALQSREARLEMHGEGGRDKHKEGRGPACDMRGQPGYRNQCALCACTTVAARRARRGGAL